MTRDPDEETIQNRLIAKKMMQDAAMKGDKVCGAYFALESIARTTPGGGYIVDTAYDYRDEDDDDDIGPF